MKTRDEFIKSVREKSKIAMAEKEAARTEKEIKKKKIMKWSAAAAACLVIAVSAGSIGNVGSMFKFGADGADTAVTESTAEPEEQTKLMVPDGGTDNASGAYSFGNGSNQLYKLPAGIVLEDLVKGSRTEITGEDIAEYMDWFYNLPDEKKLTAEESESTVRYRFTMDFSQGEDEEGVDRVFYILDGVDLP